MTDISIIIVSYNTRQLLLDCLKSLEETTLGVPIETWVVDNASTDGSAEAVQASFPNVKLLINDNNIGFARANNQIFSRVNGDIVLLLNPDTIVKSGAIQTIEQVFIDKASIGIVGPQLLNPNGSIQPSCGSFATLWTEFLFQSFLFKLIPSPFPLGWVILPHQRHRYAMKRQVDWVTGACLAIRKETVTDIGTLDEDYFMYGEDMDWCWRAEQAGYHVVYEPKARIVHYSRQASRQDYRAYIKQYTRGQLRFIAKTHSKPYQTMYGFLIFTGSLLRIFLWAGIRIILPKRKVETQQRIAGYFEAFRLGFEAMIGRSP